MRRGPRSRLALAVAAALLACAPEDGPLPERPHVLLIVVDTLRADRLSQYGYALPTGAPLRAFASRATRFTEAYAPAPWTLPSTAALMTGISPVRQRTAGRVGGTLAPERDTLAEALRRGGWRTLGLSANVVVSSKTGFDQGFDEFLDFEGLNMHYVDASKLVVAASGWIRQHVDAPLFVYLQPMNVHGPYKVPAEHRADLLGRPPRPGFLYKGWVMKGLQAGWKEAMADELSPEYRASLGEQYDTAIRYTALQVSKLLEALQEQGLYDDTLVVLTSDHGEELLDHGSVGHGQSLHQELVRIPLLIKLPRQRRARVVEQRVTLADLYPTILEVAGLGPPPGLDGRSLLPLLRGAAPEGDGREIFLHGHYEGRLSGRAIVSGPYKLVEIESDYTGARGATRLFDLERDPQERTDLAAAEPERARALAQRLHEQWARYTESALPAPPSATDELDAEVLRALGYVE